MTDLARITAAIDSLYVLIGSTEKSRQVNTHQLVTGVLDERVRTLNGIVGRLELIREDLKTEARPASW